MNTRWIKALAGALALGGAALLGANPRDGLDVRLSTAQAVVRGDGDVLVTVAVTNTTRHPIHLLRWQLPGDELEGALFRIVREDGTAVAYTGPIVKRAAPDASDHIKIEAGSTLSYQVELTGAYDLARNGRYAIQYASRGAHGAQAKSLQSDTLYLWLEGRSARATAPAAAPAPAAASLAFTGNCKTSQINQLSQAVTDATGYAASASTYLNGAPSATARYTTWFGSFSNAGWNTAKANFTSIRDAFQTQALTLDCSCRKKNTYAYVYANQPYKIYVCGAFWSAPATGTDSKAGTLVHEMSHFNVVAGTNDYAYGQTAAKALAISNPSQALDNADSHEYFAENTPFQN